tara:strand:+ start:5022 stop:5387 length:366 start_codon:yes stop_codon:yes gene_type:complete
MFITICVILIIVLKLEFKIKENEILKLEYNENKTNNIIENNEKENPYKNTLIDYIKNTNDYSILNDTINNNLNSDSSFIDPNLSIKNARSNFNIQPLNLDIYEKKNNMVNKLEKTILKKIK